MQGKHHVASLSQAPELSDQKPTDSVHTLPSITTASSSESNMHCPVDTRCNEREGPHEQVPIGKGA